MPSNIVGGIGKFFDGLGDLISNLPDKIKGVLTDVFVPDTDYIENKLDEFISNLKKEFNIDTSSFENLFKGEKPVDDVYVDYDLSGVGSLNLKVFDKTWFLWGIEKLRPIVRGFLVLMIIFYNIRQLIGFFGYDAGVVQGRSEWISYNKADTGGHKN